MFAVRPLRPERWKRFHLFCFSASIQLFERGFQNDWPALHGKVTLGAGQLFGAATLFKSDAGCVENAMPICFAYKGIRIYTNVLAGASHLSPSIDNGDRKSTR